MKKLILLALAAVILYFVASGLVRLMASPETKIRWRIQEMALDFNESRMGACVRGLHEEFVDEPSKATKPVIRAFLIQRSLNDRHPTSNVFLYRVEIVPDSFQVQLDPDRPDHASVRFVARFDMLQADAVWKPSWEVQINAAFLLDEEGWRVHRSTHKTLTGKRIN